VSSLQQHASLGMGALFVPKETRPSKLMRGAGHGCGLQAGKGNILLLAGLGKVSSCANDQMHYVPMDQG
jgi:cysteine sulfinate desulfinase/cysteine desulfurase-like protein